MLAPLLFATILLPAPQGQEPPKPAAAQDAPAIEAIDDKRAREVVKAFQKATPRNASMAQRMRAVQELAKYRHKSLVKPLLKVVQTEAAVTVAKTAAEALGNQPAKQARPAILRLIDHERVKKKPALVGTLIEALAGAGYDTRRDWKAIDDLFERKFEPEYVPVQKAILKLVAKTKEKQAVRLLLEHIDGPAPANVDDPSNPPASYWEARWKAWRTWRGDVKEALYQLTGQRFSTREEASTWIDKNGRKIGLDRE